MDSTLTLLIGWGIMGLIGLGINAAKGKSLAWGFVGGAIFGIFGWIFLALHGAGGVPCAACRETVRKGATVCRHCGAKFANPAGFAA